MYPRTLEDLERMENVNTFWFWFNTLLKVIAVAALVVIAWKT